MLNAWHGIQQKRSIYFSVRPSITYAFLLDQILASASYDDTIKLYVDDPSDDWFCFTTLTGHTSTVWSIAWAPGGKYLASASDDRTIRIWKRVGEHKWDCVLILSGHERSVYSVSWGLGKSQNEGSLGWIASVGGDGKINVWELTVSSILPVCIRRLNPFAHSGTTKQYNSYL